MVKNIAYGIALAIVLQGALALCTEAGPLRMIVRQKQKKKQQQQQQTQQKQGASTTATPSGTSAPATTGK